MKPLDVIKNYASQPSTWIGATKLGSSVGLFGAHLIDPISALILAVFGVIDIFRKEKR
jgi:hypothetical protein